MIRRQDEQTDRLALTDDASKAIMMDTGPFELQRRLVINFDRHHEHPKLKSAVRGFVEQMQRPRRRVLQRQGRGKNRGTRKEGNSTRKWGCKVMTGKLGG